MIGKLKIIHIFAHPNRQRINMELTIYQQYTQVYDDSNHIRYLLVLIFMSEEEIVSTLTIENSQYNHFNNSYRYYQPLLN
jgi:hypothetical protein